MTLHSLSDLRLRHLAISLIISITLVSMLVGNAYMYTNIGYPGYLDAIGEAVLIIGMVLVIPPGLIYSMFSKFGLLPELAGRESFIEMNPVLWVFCMVFYFAVIYSILRVRYKFNKKNEPAQDLEKESKCT